jgi:predicted O-methyltransferase YrrM
MAKRFSSDWVSQHADLWLSTLGHLRGQPVHALEIGSYEGRSACWWLDNLLTHPASQLTCIDPWANREHEAAFDANTREYGRRVVKIKGHSWKVLPTLRERSLDFTYIDGNHEAAHVLADALAVIRLVKPGGLILFDDYGHDRPEVLGVKELPREGIEAFLAVCGWQLEVLHKGWQVAVRRK